MSYDVAFWRSEGSTDRDHAAVNEALVMGQRVDGVAELEAEAMISRLAELLGDWARVDARTWEKGPAWHLQAWTSPQHLALHMSFGAARPVLLKIAKPMRRFGCGLWNAQTCQRLSGHGEGEAEAGA